MTPSMSAAGEGLNCVGHGMGRQPPPPRFPASDQPSIRPRSAGQEQARHRQHDAAQPSSAGARNAPQLMQDRSRPANDADRPDDERPSSAPPRPEGPQRMDMAPVEVGLEG